MTYTINEILRFAQNDRGAATSNNSIEKVQSMYEKNMELEIKQIQYLINRAHNLQTQIKIMISLIIKIKKIKSAYESLCNSILKSAEKWDNALGDFARNYNDMVEANTINADKYFHAKANCQAAKRGIAGNIVAGAISAFRELEEGTRKVLFEGSSLYEQIKDAKEDMKANKKGREAGNIQSLDSCKFILDNLRPNGLDDKY